MQKNDYIIFYRIAPIWGMISLAIMGMIFALAPFCGHSGIYTLGYKALGPCFVESDKSNITKNSFSGYSKIVDTLWLKTENGIEVEKEPPKVMKVNGKEYILE